MLEIQIYNEVTKVYEFLDLFEGEGVDLTIPLFPSNDLSERPIDYTDSFDLPLTERNEGYLNNDSVERYKARLVNGTNMINGFLSVNSISYNLPESSISVNFISIIKYVIDKLKETPFSNLFKDNTITGASPYQTSSGAYINDGDYGFVLDETVNSNTDSFMKLCANNHVSDQYGSTSFPVYLMDNEIGSRSAQPTFNMEKLIEAIFDYYDVEVDTSDFLAGIFEYSDCHIKIPVNFLSDSSLTDEHRRSVIYDLGADGWIDEQSGSGWSSTGIRAVTSDMDLFPPRKVETVDSVDYNVHTPQDKTSYNVTASGVRDDYFGEMWLYYEWDDGSQTQYNDIQIPSNKISYSGNLRPAIGIYFYDELVYYYEIDDKNIFYNIQDISFANITGSLSLKYGDSVRAKLGFKADRLVVTIPTYLDSDGVWEGSRELRMLDGFYNDVETLMWNEFEYEDLTTGLPATNINRVYLKCSYDNTLSTVQVTLTPKDDYVEARYSDKVLLEKSYENKELKMYDIIDKIVKRFNLSIKEQPDGSLKFIKEPDFYTENYVVIDHRLNKGVEKSYDRDKSRNISLLNKDYGNINDRIDDSDDNNKILIYDIDKYVLNESAFKEQIFNFDSTIQNNYVYGKKISANDIDTWEFLELENNTELWNANVNEKINTDNLPISFGTLEVPLISSFRIPRSVYSDTNNYPEATDAGIEANGNIMVVEHTLFETDDVFPVLKEEDDFVLSDGLGNLDTTSVIYPNFEDFIKRNSSDSVNLKCEAYLTNEEILNIRNGYQIKLFNEIYKPIRISDIKFEKEGSVCTIEMTKVIADVVTDNTFDSTGVTFDDTTPTWDEN